MLVGLPHLQNGVALCTPSEENPESHLGYNLTASKVKTYGSWHPWIFALTSALPVLLP